MSADDVSDADDDRVSTKSELNIELCSSDSESADDNTKATTREPELSDDSLCEVGGFSSHFDEHVTGDLNWVTMISLQGMMGSLCTMKTPM